MASPFDFGKSILQTKEDLYTVEELFNKEYTPFMVNRILSNVESTVLFAEVMDKYTCLDKKLQYDFYLKGVPKLRGFQKMWSKKETSEQDENHINFICVNLNVSVKRAIEIYKLLRPDDVQKELEKRGGKHNGKTKN